MPSNEERKHRQTIEYVQDILGGDVNRDLIRVAIAAQDNNSLTVETKSEGTLDVNITELGGESQLEGDFSQLLGQIAQLRLALESVGNDEIRAKTFLNDKAGNLQPVEGQPINVSTDPDQVGQVTYTARALKQNDLDQLITRVTDSQGNEIDPLTDDVLESLANDEVRASTYGVNENGDLRQLRFNTLGQGINDNLYGLVTYLSRALQSIADDELRTETINQNEAEFGVKDDTIEVGENWAVTPGERLDIDTLDLGGTLWLDGTTYVYGSISGDGTIEGDGTIVSRA